MLSFFMLGGKMNKENMKYWIWLSRIENIKSIQKEILLEKYKYPENIWKLNENELGKIKELDKRCVKEILNKNYRENLEKYDRYLKENNIKLITIFDKNYPQKLKNIYDKPIVLFAKGNLNLLNQDGVAIIGCRDCSEYGKESAKKLSYNIAKQNKCIISGLARGIDTFAHIGALEAGGGTIAVLGSGLDNIYPIENKYLYERIIQNGGLIITEYIIGAKINKLNFPQRNRIISGISDGIVVVEAKKKSGALITVDFGLEHGKEIFAVPGNINSINSIGTNNLIKQGANLVNNYKDVLDICYEMKK